MKRERRKQSLSSERKRLLRLLQDISFGRIEGLIVRNGEPVLDPLPRVIRTFKLGSGGGSRTRLAADDFVLKKQVVEMFEHFDRLGDATIEHLVVRDGLPLLMDAEESAGPDLEG